MSEVTQPRQRRRRGRKEELVAVAARLFATRGYRSVGVDDIGEALGLTGPAIYRHFPSKEALLVAVFDGVISDNLVRIREIVAEMPDPEEALKTMIAHHCRFVLEQTENLTTWRQEARNLPEDEGRRLRRLQRMYVEEWVHVISELRPDLSDVEVRTVAHAAITLLQPPERVSRRLTGWENARGGPRGGGPRRRAPRQPVVGQRAGAGYSRPRRRPQ